MTADAQIVLIGKFDQLLQEYQKLHEKQEKTDANLKRMTLAARHASKEQTDLARSAKKTIEETATATDVYRNRLTMLRKELAAGLITEQQYAAARKKAQENFKATSPATQAKAIEDAKRLAEAEKAEAEAAKKAAEAEKQRAKVLAEAQGIISRNVTAQERYNAGVATAAKHLMNGTLSLRDYRREIERLDQELADSKPVENQENLVASFVKGVTVVGLLRGAWQAVNTELDGYIDRTKQVANAQRSYAEKSREMRDNFQADATMSDADLDKAVFGISERTGIKPETIVGVASNALQQKGARTNAEVFAAVENAVRYARTDDAKGTELAQRALQFSNVFGSADQKANMGFLSEAANASAIPNIAEAVQTLFRAINDAGRRGETAETAAELAVTVNQMMGDVEGRRSATATTQLVEQLAGFVPQKRAEDAKGKFGVPKSQIDAFNAAKTPTDKLKVMQRSPELRRAFLGKGGATFETAAQASIEGLLAGTPEAMAAMGVAQGRVPTLGPGLGAAFDTEVERLGAGPIAANAELIEAGEAEIARRFAQDTDQGKVGAVHKTLMEGLASVDLPGVDALNLWRSEREYAARTNAGATPAVVARDIIGRTKGQASANLLSSDAETTKILSSLDATLKLIEENTKRGGKAPLAGGQPPAQALGAGN